MAARDLRCVDSERSPSDLKLGTYFPLWRATDFESSPAETTQENPDLKMSAVSTTGLVLSLLGLTSLAGAGVAVGSGVSMVSLIFRGNILSYASRQS